MARRRTIDRPRRRSRRDADWASGLIDRRGAEDRPELLRTVDGGVPARFCTSGAVSEIEGAHRLFDTLWQQLRAAIPGEVIPVVSMDGASNSQPLRRKIRANGAVQPCHVTSHGNSDESRERAARRSADRWPIDERKYPDWFLNGHREPVCRCGQGATSMVIERDPKGAVVCRISGECATCGPLNLTSGHWGAARNTAPDHQAPPRGPRPPPVRRRPADRPGPDVQPPDVPAVRHRALLQAGGAVLDPRQPVRRRPAQALPQRRAGHPPPAVCALALNMQWRAVHHARNGVAVAARPLIAASAVAHGLPVYTCNPVDFEGLDGLDASALGSRPAD